MGQSKLINLPTQYAAWPFRPLHERSWEESESWWQDCYLPHDMQAVLSVQPYWQIVTGRPGSGKSVAVAAIQRSRQEAAFVVDYPPDQWPHSPKAWKPGGNHLEQMMTAASLAVRNYINQNPAEARNLSPLQREFLRWLIQQFGGSRGERAYRSWANMLEPDLGETFLQVPFEELYPTCTDPLDVQGQIDELANLVRPWGFRQILFVADLNSGDGAQYLEDLRDLCTWLELTHHPGLSLLAAIPEQLVQTADVIGRVRGRVSVVRLAWPLENVLKICDLHLQRALNDQSIGLGGLVSPELQSLLVEMIEREYGYHAPAGWISLMETLLHLLIGNENFSSDYPLLADQFSEIEYHFFARHIRLELDMENHGVRRGYQLIRLDDQPFRLLSLLRRRQGAPISFEDSELQSMVGSQQNLHAIVSRIRKTIEPQSKRPIYLVNRRGAGGYWLENYL